MGFLEALLIFNIEGQPIVREEMPAEMTHFLARDSAEDEKNQTWTYAWKDDSTIEHISIYARFDRDTLDTLVHQWSLNPRGLLTFDTCVSKVDANFKSGARFTYVEGRIDRFDNHYSMRWGETNFDSTLFHYQEGLLVGKTRYHDWGYTRYNYRYEDGKITEIDWVDEEGVKSGSTHVFKYQGNKVVEHHSRTEASVQLNLERRFQYEDGKLTRIDDYFSGRPFKYMLIRYDKTNRVRAVSRAAVPWKGIVVDALGRSPIGKPSGTPLWMSGSPGRLPAR